MGAVTYPDDKVVKFVDYNFVPVQIEVSNTALMEQFKVKWTPTIIVLDADGGVCVKRERVDEVLKASEERLAKENALRVNLLAGQMSYDLHGLRDYMERNKNDKSK